MKKSFGRVPTSIEVRAMEMHDGDLMCTIPSTVSMAISGPDDRSPPLMRGPQLPAAGGREAAASMGLGNVVAAAAAPCLCLFCFKT